MARQRLGEILVNAGVLDHVSLRSALIEQNRWGGPLGRILIDMKLVSEDVLVKALSRQLNFPVVDLDSINVDLGVVSMIPAELAERDGIVPFRVEGKFLDVAMSDPTNLGIIDELRIRTQLNVRSYLVGPLALERALSKYYARGWAAHSIDPRHDVLRNMDIGIGEGAQEVDLRDLEDDDGIQANQGTKPSASQQRARTMSLIEPAAAKESERDREVRALQERITRLEALVARDEDVLRKLLGLIVDKGLATNEEIVERLR